MQTIKTVTQISYPLFLAFKNNLSHLKPIYSYQIRIEADLPQTHINTGNTHFLPPYLQTRTIY